MPRPAFKLWLSAGTVGTPLPLVTPYGNIKKKKKKKKKEKLNYS
jgi:hypothetical protein